MRRLRFLPVLAGLAGAASGQPAIETTVDMTDPGSGRARTVVRVPGGAWHALVRGAGQGWRLEALRADEAGVLETAVAPGADGWVRVPVPLPVERAGELAFAATIHPPPGYRVEDPFPARVEASGAGVRVDLPAPPSLLRFRLVPEQSSGLGLTTVVDAAALILLLGLAVLGAVRLGRAW